MGEIIVYYHQRFSLYWMTILLVISTFLTSRFLIKRRVRNLKLYFSLLVMGVLCYEIGALFYCWNVEDCLQSNVYLYCTKQGILFIYFYEVGKFFVQRLSVKVWTATPGDMDHL